MKTKAEIYRAAINVYEKALTELQNYRYGCPTSTMETVNSAIERAKNAIEWCKANDKFEDMKYAASTTMKNKISDTYLIAQNFYMYMFYGEKLNTFGLA